MSEDFPNNLLYNQDYSWVKIEKDIATLGITKSASDKVGDFVFIKLPEVGQKLEKGEVYVSLEALKWSGHLSSPLSGEITEVNDELFDEPSIINEDPYSKGWIAKIKLSNLEEKKDLLSDNEIKSLK